MVDQDGTTEEEAGQPLTVGHEPPTVEPEPELEPQAVPAEAPPEPEAAVEPPSEPDEPRDIALDLARLHLRLGSLALARSELEMLAGRGGLDAAARVDLAEARWRTGDLVGGGEAAREALSGGGETVVALVVAAEAASALGRPSEARRLSVRALTLNEGAIDPVFRGMPRSSVWPTDPAEPVPLSATLFPPDRADAVVDADRDELAAGVDQDRDAPEAALAAAAASEADAKPPEPGLWDLHEAAALAAGAAVLGPNDLDPSALFDDGRAALEAGDLAAAAVQLGLVVRLAPALAPAVLSTIGEPVDASLLLVQGDAYRAVGHETEAKRSYAAAMGIAAAPPPPPAPVEAAREAPLSPAASAWWLQALADPDPPVASAPAETPPEPTEAPSEPAWPAAPEPPTESFESSESSEPERDAGWRDDEGGWRVDQDEWHGDDR